MNIRYIIFMLLIHLKDFIITLYLNEYFRKEFLEYHREQDAKVQAYKMKVGYK